MKALFIDINGSVSAIRRGLHAAVSSTRRAKLHFVSASKEVVLQKPNSPHKDRAATEYNCNL